MRKYYEAGCSLPISLLAEYEHSYDSSCPPKAQRSNSIRRIEKRSGEAKRGFWKGYRGSVSRGCYFAEYACVRLAGKM